MTAGVVVSEDQPGTMSADLEAPRSTVEAFRRALSREAHNLARRPDLLWQQLHNRLQWEGDPVAELLDAGRSSRSAAPWLRTKRRFQESTALLGTLAGHAGPVKGCAVASDGSTVVSAGGDGTLRVWDPVSRECIRTLTGPDREAGRRKLARLAQAALRIQADVTDTADPEQLRRAARESGLTAILSDTEEQQEGELAEGSDGQFGRLLGQDLAQGVLQVFVSINGCAAAPDGSFVASAGTALRLWDPATGRLLRSLEGHTASVSDCALPLDGSFLLSASSDSTLKIWDPAAGECLRTLEGHADRVTGCAVAPDGSYVVSASDDGTLKVWDPATAECLQTLWSRTGRVNGCAVSPDGSYVISASEDGTLRQWSPATGECVRTFGTLWDAGQPVNGCAVAPDGSYVVSAGDDGALKFWDPASGECTRILEGHTGGVNECAVAPDGAYVVSASDDGTLKLWDPAAGAGLQTSNRHAGVVESCAVAPEGSFVVTGSRDTFLNLWDPGTGDFVRRLEGHGEAVKCCTVAPDGSYVVSGGADGTVKVWDPGTGECRRTLEGHTEPVLGCAVSPDGLYVLTGSADRSLKLWDPVTGAKLRTLEGHSDSVQGCAFASDGSYAVSASLDTTLKIWEPETGECLRTLGGRSGWFYGCAVAPDGSFVVAASDDRTLTLWSPSTGECLRIIEGHTDSVVACAVAPDAAFVASAGRDQTLRLWDRSSGKEMAAIPLLGEVGCVALHPWLPLAASGDEGGNVYLMELKEIEYGPIVVTAIEQGNGVLLRCPACRQEHPADRNSLGGLVVCPTAGCGLRLRVNPFLRERSHRLRRPMPVVGRASSLARGLRRRGQERRDWRIARKGGAALGEGRAHEALSLLEEAARREPHNARVWNDYAVALAEVGQTDEALEAHRIATLEAAGTSLESPTWLCRGITLHRVGRYREALDAFDRARTWLPEGSPQREEVELGRELCLQMLADSHELDEKGE